MKSDSKAGGLVGLRAARFPAEIDAELFNRAEKELAAFVAAVSTLHGEQQACAAADDWLLELTALKVPCNGAAPDLDLRSVSIGAAKRLAVRLSLKSPAAIQISVRQKASSRQRRGHGFQQDSDHRSKNSHNSLFDVRFTHSYGRNLSRSGAQHSQIQSVGDDSTQESKSMEAIGLLVTLEARRGKEADAEAFLKSAQPLAVDEKGTLKWYAIKLGPGKFGIFDTFANEGGRNAHLSGEIAKALGARAVELLAVPPQIEKVEVLASTPLKG